MSFDRVRVLDADEAKEVDDRIHGLREMWEAPKGNVIPFFTLGAAGPYDLNVDGRGVETLKPEYFDKVRKMNPILLETFPKLYERVAEGLQEALDAPVAYFEPLALPGFHVIGVHPGFVKGGRIHFDMHYPAWGWTEFEEVRMNDPISYTLTIRLPAEGGGLNLWDAKAFYMESSDPPGFHSKKADLQIKESPEPTHYIPYEVGMMLVHSGLQMHQIAPSPKQEPDDERVTLQGHGLWCDGVWRLFW